MRPMTPIFRSVLISILLSAPIVAFGEPRELRQAGEPPRSAPFELQAEHTLSLQERERLTSIGCRIVRELGGNRYIARIRPDAVSALSADPAVDSFQRIGPESKVMGKQAAALGIEGSAEANVFFFDDVSFDEARRVVIEQGGTLKDPLATEFAPSRKLRVLISTASLDQLAASDSVWSVNRSRRTIVPTNEGAAILSSVTPLHSAPYDLSGEGVTLSLFDIGSAFAAHSEFGGRLIAHDSGKADAPIALHPTHTSGTIGAAGNNPAARGMAPRARIHQYNVGDQWDTDKRTQFSASLGISTDSNSWGYAHGWNTDDKRTPPWVWYGNQYYGSYEFESDALDQLAIDKDVLIVYSSGNDGADFGPPDKPFAHFHDFGTVPEDKTVYCFSASGSGSDCPTPTCGSCEAAAHVPNGPFLTVGPLGAAKNVVAVGAIDSTKAIAGFSSRGPTLDGRVKPDLVAKGVAVYSTSDTGGYRFLQGTSMSAPVVSGISALLIEQWRRTFNGASPRPDELRALLLHGAEDLGRPGPDYTYGYGLANARTAVDTIRADQGSGLRIRRGSVSQGIAVEFGLNVLSGNPRVTLAWTDPGAGPSTLEKPALINDLDLVLVDPSGIESRPWILNPATPDAPAATGRNGRDNLEQIDLANAVPGVYKIRVMGSSVPTLAPQSFIVVANADIGNFSPACYDVFEPNNDEASAFGRLSASGSITPRVCSASDVDFFRFTVDRSGEVVVTLTTTETPLRATLSAPGTTTLTTTIAANTTETIRTQAGSGTNQTIAPIQYVLKIEAAGSVPAIGSAYTIATTFNASVVPRRRAATRR